MCQFIVVRRHGARDLFRPCHRRLPVKHISFGAEDLVRDPGMSRRPAIVKVITVAAAATDADRGSTLCFQHDTSAQTHISSSPPSSPVLQKQAVSNGECCSDEEAVSSPNHESHLALPAARYPGTSARNRPLFQSLSNLERNNQRQFQPYTMSWQERSAPTF